MICPRTIKANRYGLDFTTKFYYMGLCRLFFLNILLMYLRNIPTLEMTWQQVGALTFPELFTLREDASCVKCWGSLFRFQPDSESSYKPCPRGGAGELHPTKSHPQPKPASESEAGGVGCLKDIPTAPKSLVWLGLWAAAGGCWAG